VTIATRTNPNTAGSGAGRVASRDVLLQCDQCGVIGTGRASRRGRVTFGSLPGSTGTSIANRAEDARLEWVELANDPTCPRHLEDAGYRRMMTLQTEARREQSTTMRHTCGGRLVAYDTGGRP
jgi:hypothetical protein